MLWHKVQGAGANPRLWNNPDLDNATYDSVSVSTPLNLTDVFFKPDGTRFYTAEGLSTLREWTMTTAWDITTASSGDTASFAGVHTIFFKPDGTRFYWVNNNFDRIEQVDLSTAWDITTMGSSSIGAPAVGSVVRGVVLSTDGTKFYSADRGTGGNHQIEQFNLSTAWDITSPSASSTPDEILDVATQSLNPLLTSFNPDGTKLWVTSISYDNIAEYDLTTPWDVSTGSYSGSSLSLASQDDTPQGAAFKTDGSKLYVAGTTSDAVLQYSTA